MANAVPSRLGQADLDGDAEALFLKVFAGEVLTAFSESNVFGSRHRVRTITSGKSASFPATWKGGASYHTPGAELPGTTIAHNERIIAIDDLLVADRFIANIDEAMNHYDVRSEYSRDIGRALAKTYDTNVAQVSLLASFASATVTDGFGGSIITNADADDTVAELIDAIFEAAAVLDSKDVPDEDRYVYVKPTQYYMLVNSDLVNKDSTNGNGGLDSGTVFSVAGFEIVKTNNLPQGDVDSGPTAYQGDFTNTAALVAHKSAAGTVKLIDLGMEMQYDIRRQGTLMVGKYAVGHGILRPESAVQIRTADPAL